MMQSEDDQSTCYFELPKPVQLSHEWAPKTFDEMSAAQLPDLSTDSVSFTEYLENIAASQASQSHDIIHLSTVGAVSEQTQTNYSYEFEEYKTADELQIEAQAAYEAYQAQVIQTFPANETAQYGFVLLWGHNFKNF